MRHVIVALCIVAGLVLSGCAAHDATTADGVIFGSSKGFRSLESSVGAPMSIAADWSDFGGCEHSLSARSKEFASHLIISRMEQPSSDFASRIDSETQRPRSKQVAVFGPIATRLFGQDAVAVSLSGPKYSRIMIASEHWWVTVGRQAPFDAAWARSVSAMLSRDGRGPEVPAPE
ncbi:MAG: hypothetical protein U1E26_00005 [Coriobacteriia bacterium]|nr:hypothetical protein [Coriobacteriia bacterium]